ncbi:MAG: M13 family metallopeptidase [Elusimicrobia bacterium]|nr:M13 family metallopeptidase [Elusimicrobiota bacterium]
MGSALTLLAAVALAQTKVQTAPVPIAPGIASPVLSPGPAAAPLAGSLLQLSQAALLQLPQPLVSARGLARPARATPLAGESKASGLLGRLELAVGRMLGQGAPAAEPDDALRGIFGERADKGDAVEPGAGPRSGLDYSSVDRSVRPQDDLFRYANGAWLNSYRMPADKSRFGSFDLLSDKSEEAVKAIVDEASRQQGADARKIAGLYRSFMDEERIEAQGLKPLERRLRAIEALKSKAQLPRFFGAGMAEGGASPVAFGVGQDAKDPDRNLGGLGQSGLGLPEREYYFKEGEDYDHIRTKYVEYLAKLFTLAGDADGAAKARRVYALEKKLAEHHWTLEQNRDVEKTYNKIAIDGLAALAPGFDWKRFLLAAGLAKTETHVDVGQPSYLTGFAEVLGRTSLEDWKLYLRVHEIAGSAPYLPKAFVDARFDFLGRTLSGQPEPRPRWKRGVTFVDGAMGEAVGKLYVERHFPPEAAARARKLVDNVVAAYRARIEEVDWMDPATKAKALEKLDRLTVKIGYPEKTRDYSKLEVRADDLLGNIRRSNRLDWRRMLAKQGKPVDRSEWGMTPHTVNAYYMPVWNEIVFPAAILQAPFFNPEADDAVNYASIGAIIGHEISHGFDDAGSKFDASGKLHDWWTPRDREQWEAKGRRLIDQANAYEVLPGKFINGINTLGENIADLGGLTIAYDAYRLSLGGKEAPVIDGLTGDQRFFLGWAQGWKTAIRDEAMAMQLATDEHPPESFRVNVVASNLEAFHRAFGLKPGDKLYRAPADRAKIW